MIFADSDFLENSVIRNFRITAADGKNYDVKHYSLQRWYLKVLNLVFI